MTNNALNTANAIAEVVKSVLNRDDVHAETDKDVQVTTQKIVDAVAEHAAENKVAVVPVKSPLTSTQNWKSIIAVIAMGASLLGFDLSPEDQVKVLSGIIALSEVFSIIKNTFFKASVVSMSVR